MKTSVAIEINKQTPPTLKAATTKVDTLKDIQFIFQSKKKCYIFETTQCMEIQSRE